MKRLFTSLLAIIFAASLGLAFAQAVRAQVTPAAPPILDDTEANVKQLGAGTGFIQDESEYATTDREFVERFSRIINIVLGAVGVLAAAYLIYSGVIWLTAEGNDEKVKQAKTGIRNAIIGIAVIFLGYIVVNFVVVEIINAARGV